MPLIVGEAPGKTEDETGIPFHPEAEAGGLFTRLMARVGVERARFSITNCCWQRPKFNELYDKDGNRLPYTTEALDYWKPYLHELITELNPPVIIGLGRTALEVLTGFSDISTTRGYINLARIEVAKPDDQWDLGDDPYDRKDLNTPTICTYHPQFLNYGQRHLSGVFIRDVLEGLDLGAKGWHPPKLNVTPNPTVEQFRWFCQQYNPERHSLTYDIENPETRGVDEDVLEEELGKKEISYVVDRMSFCFDTGIGGYSVPYTDPFIGMAKQLLASHGVKRGHNCRLHDRPRLAHNGFEVNGREEDTLELWRHLHRTLPAAIAYIAPFYLSISPWKHEAHTQPEWYSAMDAVVQHLCGEGIERDLRATGQWEIAQRHVVEVLALTEKMAENGLPFDAVRAKEFEKELELKQQERLTRLQELVPQELCPVKQKKGLKRVPKDCTGYVLRLFTIKWEEGTEDEKSQHMAKEGLPREEWDDIQPALVVPRWALLEEFNPNSHVQVKALIKHFGHKAKTDRKSKEETSGDATLKSLITSHLDSARESDTIAVECYQIIRECRAISKVLGTYVKGWRPGSDGLIHSTPGIWGDMFRISWRKPNLAATVADKKEIQIAAGFRKCIACGSDEVLIESDWRSQEAVILAHYAQDESYMRLARMSLNAYMASHLLNRPADLAWSDADLRDYLREIRSDPRNTKVYDDAKHAIYLVQNGGTFYLLSEMYEITKARAKYLIDFYYALWPKVKAFQQKVLRAAHEQCRLVNEWGYRLPCWDIYTWKQSRYEKLRKLWVRYKTDPKALFSKDENNWLGKIELVGDDSDRAISSLCYDLGTEAKGALSFFPRDTGSAMLKDALLALEDEYSLISRGFIRATAHDSILALAKRGEAQEVAEALRSVQERPVARLGGLVVEVEQKFGGSWDKAAMRSRMPLELAHA